MARETVPFTREDIAEHVRGAFEPANGVGRRELLEALRDSGAPYGMLELVAGRLPEGARMRELRGLWDYLRDVPLDREAP